jgi:hypothetical protein
VSDTDEINIPAVWLDEPEEKKPRKWIPRETWRQEKAVVWVRNAVMEPHIFFAYDRAQPRGDKSHLFQWRRGVRADTLDTELLTSFASLRFEFKTHGTKVKDGDGQHQMIEKLRSLNVFAGWGVTIEDLYRFYAKSGVRLANNAHYQALHYDGMVDSRIAKEELKQAGSAPVSKKKKAAPKKAPPRFTVGKRALERTTKRGIPL